jgi:hypothetical protein
MGGSRVPGSTWNFQYKYFIRFHLTGTVLSTEKLNRGTMHRTVTLSIVQVIAEDNKINTIDYPLT